MRNRKTFDRVVLVLACMSLALAILEGFFYYEELRYHDGLRILMIIKNGIGGFSFAADISIADVLERLGENPTLIEIIVGYAYSVAVVIAPLCTVVAIGRIFESLLGLRIRLSFPGKKEYILICGYNENVHTMLENNQKEQEKRKKQEGWEEWKKQRIRVVTSVEPAGHVRRHFMNSGVTFHTEDCLSCSDAELKKLFREVEFHKIQKIILFEDSAEKNFSLYYLLNNYVSGSKAKALPKNVKVYLSCDNEGIHRLLENYYNSESQRRFELETFSLSELQVRKLFENRPLQAYYENSNKSPHDWKIHLLILGFGGLGQQVLLQAMNLGVSSWRNEILIDVVDRDVKKKQDIFGSRFHREYVKMEENEFTIPQDNVDGDLCIRFHQMDVCGKEFQDFLNTAGGKDPFTYIVICMQDTKASLHALFETESFLIKRRLLEQTVIGIRMDSDAQMARYLKSKDPQNSSVYVIGGSVSIASVCDNKNNAMAREYHKIYSNIQIKVASPEPAEVDHKETVTEDWQYLSFYKQDSNRALAYHNSVKEGIIVRYGKECLGQYFDNKDGPLHREGKAWVFHGTEQQLLEWIKNNTFLQDMAMLEHRRWCLFMACKGWGATEGEKDEAARENPCMVNWDNLCRNQPDMCKYDLIPLLTLYEATADRQ